MEIIEGGSDVDRTIGRAQFAVYGSPAAVKTSQSGGVGSVPAIGVCKKVKFTRFPLRTLYNCGVLSAIKSCLMASRRSGHVLSVRTDEWGTRPEYHRAACWVEVNVSPSPL